MRKTDKGRSKRVSSMDVASRAKVSQATVSRVFSDNKHLVSEEKREKILQVAKEMGYEPSFIGRSLSKNSTNIIGLIVEDFDNDFFVKTVDYFTHYFQEANYSIMVFNSGRGKELESIIKLASQYQVDGLVITTATLSSESISWCLKLNKTPVFLFNRVSEGLELNSVCCRNYEAAYMIGDYLINKGKRKLMFIAGDENYSTSKEKKKGFFDATKNAGLNKVETISGSYTYEFGMEAGRQFVENNYDIDAVFCASDYIARGFYDYIQHYSQLSIPEDISLVGFDGVMDNINYPITTYKQPLEEMVQETVNLMVSEIKKNGQQNVSIHLSFSGKLVEKQTVK